MIRTSNRSHAGILEKYRIALDKAESNPEIARAMKKTGYDSEGLKEGKDILELTWEIFDANLQIKDDLSLARRKFSKHRSEMDSRFREHRKKALLIFHNNNAIAENLDLGKRYPTRYAEWIGRMTRFYEAIVENQEIQQSLLRLNFTKEEAEAELDNIEKLFHIRAESIQLKGLSQQSTVDKNKAFGKLTEWMSVFYGAARLALKKEPELLEVLYKSA